jgi:hypothetical protein
MAMEFDLIPPGTLLQENGHGETRAVLELALVPEVNFIRPGWDLNRWGRVAPLPMFVLGLHLAEIPAMPLHVPQSHASVTT